MNKLSKRAKVLAISIFLHGLIMMAAEHSEFVTDPKIVNTFVQESTYSVGKTVKAPYRKFCTNHRRLSVCSLHRTEKVAMCILLLGDERYEYVIEKSSPTKYLCRRVNVEIQGGVLVRTVAFRCSTPYRSALNTHYRPATLNYSTTASYYISAASRTNAVILHYQHVGPQTRIKPDLVVVQFPRRHLSARVREEKMKPYRPTKAGIPPFEHEMMPQRIFNMKTSTIRNAPITENEVLYFVRNMKKIKLPYRKLLHTWHVNNLCQLSTTELVIICSHIFENNLFGFEIRNDYQSRYECGRQTVHFHYSEYVPIKMSLVQCHILGPLNKNSYYVSVSGWKNTVLSYIQYHPHVEILPDGYCTNTPQKVIGKFDGTN